MPDSAIRLRGIIPPMVTPLSTPSQLDEAATRRQLRRLLAGGVHGVFILGTTGEGPSLGTAVKAELIRVTCDEVRGAVPILAGISDAAFEETVRLAHLAADCGVTALTVTPPYYFPLGQDEIAEYFQHLARRLPLPFVVYDIPAMTKVHIEPETMRRLLAIPSLIGIKDSSGQMIYHHELLRLARDRADVAVLIGPEELLAEAVAAGGDGGVPGGANLDPALYVQLYEAARRQDSAALARLRERLFLLRGIYQRGRYGSSVIKGVKCALKLMGVCTDLMAEPFQPFGPAQTAEIAAILRELELLDAPVPRPRATHPQPVTAG
jgi:2-dehydro-3-deoxy-D-pentonate aldolase